MDLARYKIVVFIAAMLVAGCESKQQECPKPEPPACPEPECPESPPEPPTPQSIIATYAPSTPWTSASETPRDSECQLGMSLVTIGGLACCCWVVRMEIIAGVFVEIRLGCVCGGGYDPQGGYIGCFPAGTEVTLADGSTRAIEQLVAGDEVLSIDPDSKKLVTAKVLALETVADSRAPMLDVDGLQISIDHPIVVEDHLVRANLLGKGDRVYKLGPEGKRGIGDKVELVPIGAVGAPRVEPNATTLYNLDVDGSNTYFARSVLVHEKLE
jgi:hypothetical protein